jgi:uncharacterized delta-60 repeat protein
MRSSTQPPEHRLVSHFQTLERRVMLNAGALDTAFGDMGLVAIPAAATEARLTDLAVMEDGRFVMTGTSEGGVLTVMRFHPDGTPDNSFGDGGRAVSQLGGNSQALGVAIQPDNRIIAVGLRGTDYFVLRYQTNGKHDRTFGDGGLVSRTFNVNVSEARGVEVLDDGSIVVAGNARLANGSTAAAVARFDSAGRLDPRFGSNGSVITKFSIPLNNQDSFTVNRLTLAPDQKLVLAGRYSSGALFPVPGDDALAIMRFNADGTADATFSRDGVSLADFGTTGETASGVAVDNQLRPVVSVRGADAFAAFRVLANGRRDDAFGTNGLARASGNAGDAGDVLIDRRGDVVLAGELLGQPRLARLTSGGNLDTAFGSQGITSPPVPLVQQARLSRVAESPDNTYVVGGTGNTNSTTGRQLGLAKVFADVRPAATLAARTVRTPRIGSYVFVVQWRASGGIDVDTIGGGNLRVTGPGGYSRTASIASIDSRQGPSNIIVRYKVPPPDGITWSAVDNGTYRIAILPGGVQSLDGVAADAGSLGTFVVSVG